jgi:hypothetical protein
LGRQNVALAASIENALAPLIGLPLWAAGHAADMLWLSLGAKVHAPSMGNPNRETGEYALHVQCPWRISGVAGLIAGSSDLAAADLGLARWLDAHTSDPLRVISIRADRRGGFIAGLTNESRRSPPGTRMPTDAWVIYCKRPCRRPCAGEWRS